MSLNFLEKEEALLKRLEETEYALFHHQKDKALDYIIQLFENMFQYSDMVLQGHLSKMKQKELLNEEEFQQYLDNFERERWLAYETSLGSICQLNLICEELGLEPLADVDKTNCLEVAEAVGYAVQELYNRGIHLTHINEKNNL